MLLRRKAAQEWKPIVVFSEKIAPMMNVFEDNLNGTKESQPRTPANYVSDNISSDYSRVSAKNYDMKGHAANMSWTVSPTHHSSCFATQASGNTTHR